MSSNMPADIPGNLPVLTEVVGLAAVPVSPRQATGAAPDPEQIMQALRPLLEAHARALTQVLMQEQARMLQERLPQELELVARQVLLQVLTPDDANSPRF